MAVAVKGCLDEVNGVDAAGGTLEIAEWVLRSGRDVGKGGGWVDSRVR